LDIGVLGISVLFDLRNTLPKSGPFLLLHPVYGMKMRHQSKFINLSSSAAAAAHSLQGVRSRELFRSH